MMDKQGHIHRVDVLEWKGEGFQPLVKYRDWQVALMNWEARFDIGHVGEVERHNGTDEVFVLLRGRGLLFIVNDEGLRTYDMTPWVIYNVTKGTWHGNIGTKETGWLIVESSDPGDEQTDFRKLSEGEMEALRRDYPSWVK